MAGCSRLLFGGALIAAGIASEAGAQELVFFDPDTLPCGSAYPVTLAYADADQQPGDTVIDQSCDPADPEVNAAVSPPNIRADARIDRQRMFAVANRSAQATTNPKAQAAAYFSADIPTAIDLTWSFEAGSSVVLYDVTADSILLFETPSSLPAATVAIALNPGHIYLFNAQAEAQSTGSSTIFAAVRSCYECDLDDNRVLNVDDIDLFVSGFLAADLAAADCDNNAKLCIDDIDCFVACFLGGCP